MSAAGGGHLHVLKYARANGCPWDETAVAHALFYGRSETLEWALANGCPHFKSEHHFASWFWDDFGFYSFGTTEDEFFFDAIYAELSLKHIELMIKRMQDGMEMDDE